MLVCHAGCVCVCCIYVSCTQKAKGKEKGERFLRACELPQIGEVCGVGCVCRVGQSGVRTKGLMREPRGTPNAEWKMNWAFGPAELSVCAVNTHHDTHNSRDGFCREGDFFPCSGLPR